MPTSQDGDGDMPNPKHEDWMTPLNKIIWMRAFKAKATEVTLRDGRKFIINYDVEPLLLKTTGEKRVLCHVKPADGSLAPRGYIDLKEATHNEWLKVPNVKS